MPKTRLPTTNNNPLMNNRYELVLTRWPNVQFRIQTIKIPSIGLSGGASTPQSNHFTDIPIPSEKASFGLLNFSFLIDEDMQSWFEVYEWIKGLGRVEDSEGYATLSQTVDITEGLKSDLIVSISNSKHNENIEFTFEDAFPISLSGFDLTNVSDNPQPLVADVIMQYTLYTVRRTR